MAKKRALCLNMIVKNEMANLDRCLRSVAPYIDCWVIGDTGSTDGTQDFIRAFFAERGIPGEVHEFPFHDFAQARNEALARARASKLKFDYLLLTDADMELVVEDETFAERLGASAYKVLQRSGVAYWNVRLVARKVPSSYKGVTHEYLDIRKGETLNLEGISYIDHATGSNRFEKYERDVRLLKGAIEKESDPGLIARYTFYLANTYRDAGQAEEAIAAYGERVKCGGWAEEVFVSQFNIARIKEEQGRPEDEVVAAYETAAAAAPWRAEALHAAARYCRDKGRYAQGYDFAQRGLAVPYPHDSLFVQDWIHEYGLLDELGVNAYWVGAYDASIAACDRLLAEAKIPEAQRARVEKNRALSVAKLAEAAAEATDDPFLIKLRAARAREQLGGDPEEILAAYAEASEIAPHRAEALHDAARFCRSRGLNERAWELAARGLALPIPEDAPALERWVYEWGLQQEFSIAANYARDPAIKDRGFAACDWLALNRDVPEAVRNLAHSNLHFYVQPATALLPSFTAHRVEFDAPDGYHATNPSIARAGDRLVLVQRTVNYVIDPTTSDDPKNPYVTPGGVPYHTRNFLLDLDADLTPTTRTEIEPPIDFPNPKSRSALGFEDLRPFAWKGQLWGIAAVRELTADARYQQVLARIDEQPDGACRLADWQALKPGREGHEKNWMPFVEGETLRFVYGVDPTRIVDEAGNPLGETTPPADVRLFRGGSQLVRFDDGWLALTHEARLRDGRRHYRHRFFWFDRDLRLRKLTRPFYFQNRGIEFAAGLAAHPDGKRLVITYGVDDAESWIATVETGDVRAALEAVSDRERRVTTETRRADVESPSELSSARISSEELQFHFIVGLPRSGTTLLRAMLGAHSQVCAPSETPWITGAYGVDVSLRQLLLELSGSLHGPVKKLSSISDADLQRAAKRFLQELFASKAQAEGKNVVVLKTPEDILFVDDLLGFFPDSKVIHIRRDVRDVALSTVEARFWTLNHFGENNFENAVLRWLEWEAKLESSSQINASVRSIFYEDLIASPEVELKKITDTLGIAFETGMLSYSGRFADPTDWEVGTRDVLRQTTLNNSRRFAYRQVAPTPEQRRVIEVNSARIEALGYPGGWQVDAPSPDGETEVVEAPLPRPQRSTRDTFFSLFPYLSAIDSAAERREQSRPFDAGIASKLGGAGAALPQVHSFYEVLSDNGRHDGLIAAVTSQRAAGHPVKVWSYSPQKLEFLRPLGVELADAADVVPRGLFEQVMQGTEIRYFSDVFRYAVLYEHGGLWLDSDIVLLRPFPFRGDHFFNLQWRSGIKGEHFVCGNVIYAKPFSPHLRRLYELSLQGFHAGDKRAFGEVGPKLLSDYIASDEGAELRGSVASPMFFNSIDWTEIDRFGQPMSELADFLGDERVFGVHLWTAKQDPSSRDSEASLISVLSQPQERWPSLTDLADRFNTDKNRHTGNHHAYARVYDRLLASRRLATRQMLEIGGRLAMAKDDRAPAPSTELWQAYSPFAHVFGVDKVDASHLNDARFTALPCDPSDAEQMRALATRLEPGSLDLIVDNGSHASREQQLALSELFQRLAPGGWYAIESLDWQPPGEDRGQIALTKDLLRDLQGRGAPSGPDPFGVAQLHGDIAEILFFDSHYELTRARLMGGLVAIRKRGGSGFGR
jgi:glycosyltransferase involved in cell wall biosynthesis